MENRKLQDKFLRREIGNTCVCFNLRRAARLVTQKFDKALRPSGLKANQFSILMASYDQKGTLLTRMAKALGMERTTLTRNLAHLEKLEMVTIRPGQDRRERIITITEKGADSLEKALPLWQKAQRDIVNIMGREKRREMLSGLCEVGRRL